MDNPSAKATEMAKSFEPQHDKTNKLTCAPCEYSDQPVESTARTDQTGQMPGLIRDFAGRTDHFACFVVLRLIKSS